MSISSISSSLAAQTYGLNGITGRKTDMNSLLAALKSGNLNQAQVAYSALTQDGVTPLTNSPLARIGQDLQNGNISDAQTIAGRFQTKVTNNSSDSNSQSSNNSLLSKLTTGSIGISPGSSNSLDKNQAVSAFISSLMSALQGGKANSSSTSSSQSANDSLTAPTQSASQAMANATAQAQEKNAKKSSGHGQHGHHGGGGHSQEVPSSSGISTSSSSSSSTTISALLSSIAGESVTPTINSTSQTGTPSNNAYSIANNTNQLSATLQNLIEQLSVSKANTLGSQISTNPTTTDNSYSESNANATNSTQNLSELQNNFNSMVQALGGSAVNSMNLDGFLQKLSNNLQNSTIGNLIDTST